MYYICKDLEEYKILKNTRVARNVLRTLDANWLSFFSCIKKWKENKSLFNGKPNLPKYLDKNGKFTAIFTENSILVKNKNGEIGLSQTNIRIKPKTNGKIIEIQLIPLKNKKFKLCIYYDYKENQLKKDNSRYCSIDLGVNNLMTLTSNVGLQPLIINGRPLKSINQYYNKILSKLKSELPKNVFKSLKINKLTYKRNLKIEDYLHNASKYVIDYCIKNELNTIIIGYNELWKQKSNMSKKNNQNFVSIPFYKLINMIEYKCKMNGLNVIKHEESYTSKCSSIDLELIKKQEVYLGKRIKRGLFKTKNGLIINADVNGSLNILRKAIPNVIFTNGIEDCAVNPKRIKSFKHKQLICL
jgi:putative transposase